MIRVFGIVTFAYGLLVLGLAYWIFDAANGNFDSSKILSIVLLIIHGLLQMVYVSLTFYLLKLPLANDISTLDDFIAQDIEVDTHILKPTGFAVACGILGFVGMATMSIGAAFMLYFYARSGLGEPGLLSIAILITAIPSFLYTVRTIGTRRVDGTINPNEKIEFDEEYSFDQFEKD
jgi:hypothetical protein